MKKWYEQKYVNHRDWMIDHLDLLGLSTDEFTVCMVIDFMNEHDMDITLDGLCKKTNMNQDAMNQVISVLCAKQYLEIRASRSSILFSLNGLFETDTAKEEKVLNTSLFDVFETEFSRPLTPNEMEKISDWNKEMDRKFIMYALREASIAQKVSIPYIDAILTRWKKQNITLEMIEAGKAYDSSRNPE